MTPPQRVGGIGGWMGGVRGCVSPLFAWVGRLVRLWVGWLVSVQALWVVWVWVLVWRVDVSV